MDVEWESRPVMHHPRADWHDHHAITPFPTSSPQTAFPSMSQRRRSSAAHARPSGPPPNLPIPSLPGSSQAVTTESLDDSISPSSRINGRAAWSTPYARPSVSPNLSAVAAFSQSRQAVPLSSESQSVPIHSSLDDLSDSPPHSFLPSASSSSQSPNRNRDLSLDQYLNPQPDRRSENRSENRPSSRRALTRALELAREAVQLDSTNDNPEAAVNAYAQSVALLSEVMERVRRGEDSTDNRRRRRRSVAAQEEEVRRLQNIHDTYADRMNILSIIYSIPAVPYTTSSMYSSMSTESTTSNSPTTSPSPSSDRSPQMPQQVAHNASDVSDETPCISQDYSAHNRDLTHPHDTGSVYILDETVLSGTVISASSSSSQHPYATPYEPLPQATASQPRSSILLRRARASSNLPPPPPPPSNSLPPAPASLLAEPPVDVQMHHAHRPESLMRPSTADSTVPRRISGSGLAALEEENDDMVLPEAQRRSQGDKLDSRNTAQESTRTMKRDSPPLPPLPSPPAASGSSPGTPRTSSFITKPPPSPRLSNPSISRPRGSSQLTTRSELGTQPQPHVINTTTTQGTIYQRRTKTSAPPSTRSASPAESITSAGSIPQSKPLSLPSGRSRSSSQPGRRPSLVGGRISPPPLPNNGTVVNGSMRKASFPSKLNPNTSSIQLDSLSAPSNNSTAVPAGGFPANLPTTPTSPLPPIPPSDPLLKPYHMMNLLRNTMTSTTGGYVTRRLHVPYEVWSQGGAKLSNVVEKVRVVSILCSALEDLQFCSSEYFGAGSVSSGLAMGIGSIGRKEADAWLSKLEDFSNVCDGVVANFGKKLGVGEGFVLKKTTWGDKLTRRFDKFTNGKNLDSPAAYVQGLKRLFLHAQLLDEHTRAVHSQPLAPAYVAFPMDVRIAAEQKLRRSSDFFATVVLTFVIRDLSQLLDKYAKKCEKWLAE